MEASWRRDRGGGITGGVTMEDASWRSHHRGGSQEEAARRRQPGGTSRNPGGAKRHQEGPLEAPGGTQVAAKRNPDLYLCLCLYLY